MKIHGFTTLYICGMLCLLLHATIHVGDTLDLPATIGVAVLVWGEIYTGGTK